MTDKYRERKDNKKENMDLDLRQYQLIQDIVDDKTKLKENKEDKI